jgi:hypothetical protein
MMKKSICLKILSLSLVILMGAAMTAQAQTSLTEVRTTTNAMEQMDGASTGPSPQVINRVQNDLNQPGNTQAPPQAATGAETAPAAPPAPAVPVQPVGQTPDSMPENVEVDSATGEEEGQPFSLTAATQFANQGMAALRGQNFNQAVEAYRQAKDNDPKYEKFYDVVVQLRDRVNAGELAQVRNEKVQLNNVDLTWGQFLGWQGGQFQQIDRFGYSPGLGPMGPMGPMGGPQQGRGGQMSPEMMMQQNPGMF